MKNISVSRTKSGRYFVSIQVEAEMADPEFTGEAVRLALVLAGVCHAVDRLEDAPPRYDRKVQKKRGRLARQRSQKKLGSRNREKARLHLARLDELIANQCRDFHHKDSRTRVDENQFIELEDLNVQGMLANRRLAKSMGDAP